MRKEGFPLESTAKIEATIEAPATTTNAPTVAGCGEPGRLFPSSKNGHECPHRHLPNSVIYKSNKARDDHKQKETRSNTARAY